MKYFSLLPAKFVILSLIATLPIQLSAQKQHRLLDISFYPTSLLHPNHQLLEFGIVIHPLKNFELCISNGFLIPSTASDAYDRANKARVNLTYAYRQHTANKTFNLGIEYSYFDGNADLENSFYKLGKNRMHFDRAKWVRHTNTLSVIHTFVFNWSSISLALTGGIGKRWGNKFYSVVTNPQLEYIGVEDGFFPPFNSFSPAKINTIHLVLQATVRYNLINRKTL